MSEFIKVGASLERMSKSSKILKDVVSVLQLGEKEREAYHRKVEFAMQGFEVDYKKVWYTYYDDSVTEKRRKKRHELSGTYIFRRNEKGCEIMIPKNKTFIQVDKSGNFNYDLITDKDGYEYLKHKPPKEKEKKEWLGGTYEE